MILSDIDIQRELNNGEIQVSPFDASYIGPASVDLHLDKHFSVFKQSDQLFIDPKFSVDDMMEEIIIEEDGYFVLHPNSFALGLIYEETGVSEKFVGRLEGKSSVGRLGLLIHVTAGFLDPGNCLKMTLELHNTSNLPIKLYYKMPIAQMAFERLETPASKRYSDIKSSKYVSDKKIIPSQMWRNFT